MDLNQKICIWIMIAASAVLFVLSLVWLGYRIIQSRRLPERKGRNSVSTALGFSVFLVVATLVFRVAVGFYTVFSNNSEGLVLWEEGFARFFETLLAFGVEEGYSEYIKEVNAMIAALVSAESDCFLAWKTAIALYASLLSLIAPFAGGAIIIEVLARVFPKFKLKIACIKVWRKKVFFSELNASSLALAKSIIAESKRKKPILVFTDTYIDDEKESEYELLLEAKRYGAVCIRDDLTHVLKPKKGKREFYLMDENEFGNLQTLMGLVEDRNVEYLKDSHIYLFVQSDAYVQIEKQVKLALNSAPKKALLKGGAAPVIIPVRSYRNLVNNLFIDVPLYEPLVNNTLNNSVSNDLSVTILGNGIIGTEAFLSTYWFGQIMVSNQDGEKQTMDDCNLTINVVSKDTAEEFWAKIDYINPEIKLTVEVEGDTQSKSANTFLDYNLTGAKNLPYCRVRYTQADVKIGGFWNAEIEKTQSLLDSNYFIVALGDDADNISVAEKLRCSIGKKHIEATDHDADNISVAEKPRCSIGKKHTEATDQNKINNAVIAYAVFDSNIAQTINKQKRYQTRGDGNTDIYMHAFGSLEQVYSCDNVYMSKSKIIAQETGSAYAKLQTEKNHIDDNESRAKNDENSNYNYWSDLARASHVKYKVFSLGWIKTSLFSYYGDEIKVADDGANANAQMQILPLDSKLNGKIVSADDYHRNLIKQLCKKYKRTAILNKVNPADVEGQRLKKDLELKKHCLAWLEHRRWNAYTRASGYQYVNADKILNLKNSHKDMQLKLHACLVEAGRPKLDTADVYIYADFKENGKVDTETTFKNFDTNTNLDTLDLVSYARRKRDETQQSDDFKVYDYYRYEFEDYLSLDEVCQILDVDEKTVIERCEKEKYKDAFCYGNYEWHIPAKSLSEDINQAYRKLNPKDDSALIKQIKNKECRGVELFGCWYAKK